MDEISFQYAPSEISSPALHEGDGCPDLDSPSSLPDIRQAPFTEQEFQRIHETYSRRLIKWFRKRVRGDVAEELASDTFLKVWQSEHRGDCSVKTWIYTVAASVLADRYKCAAKKRDDFLERATENRVALERWCTPEDDSGPVSWEEASGATDYRPDPEQVAMIRQQLAGRFSDPRLESLDALTKQILIRRFAEGESVEEIASGLELSASAVYKIISRVRPK